jgi:LmbE family N-acetylglucosaminyl deacetylase
MDHAWLVIAAHPDDETLGCGGAILRAIDRQGTNVQWLILTKYYDENEEQRSEQVAAVEKAYGTYFQLYNWWELPSGELFYGNISYMMRKINDAIVELKPQAVFVPFYGDVHTDHYLVYRAITSVLKPAYMAYNGINQLYCYETPSSTEGGTIHTFCPDTYIDISPYLKEKIEIAQLYKTEASHPLRTKKGLTALASYRGATIGVNAAEAFKLVRRVVI